MIKRRPHTKTPLLATGWPVVRLTLAGKAALIGAGLRRFGPVRERTGAGGGSGPRPPAGAPLGMGSRLLWVTGELHPFENRTSCAGRSDGQLCHGRRWSRAASARIGVRQSRTACAGSHEASNRLGGTVRNGGRP